MADLVPSGSYALIKGRIGLLAVDRARNIARRYAIKLTTDLFGYHVLERAWGRVGGWTAAKRISFVDLTLAERVVAGHLRRRASAGRRIGVADRPVEARMKVILALVAVLIPAVPAGAWGNRGHRAIADIAWTELTPAAKRDVAQLLAGAPDLATPTCPVASFEDGATWADCVRARYRGRYGATATWHYVDVSICRPFELPEDRDARFIVARYERELAVLADASAPSGARLEALLWVEHLVGDLHQPLHVGDAGDRGGNEVSVYPSLGRYPVNLHAEWDHVLVDDAVRGLPGGVAALAAGASDTTHGGSRVTSAAAWARESWELARRDAYPQSRLGPGPCVGENGPVEVGADYRAAAIPIVRRQLEQAGIRLAVVLNGVFR